MSSAWVLARRGRCGPCIALMTKKVEEGLRRVRDLYALACSSAGSQCSHRCLRLEPVVVVPIKLQFCTSAGRRSAGLYEPSALRPWRPSRHRTCRQDQHLHGGGGLNFHAVLARRHLLPTLPAHHATRLRRAWGSPRMRLVSRPRDVFPLQRGGNCCRRRWHGQEHHTAQYAAEPKPRVSEVARRSFTQFSAMNHGMPMPNHELHTALLVVRFASRLKLLVQRQKTSKVE